MRTTKRIIPLTALLVILVTLPLFSQTELVSRNFFPAAFEFKELQSVRGEKNIEDAQQILALEHGAVLAEAGLQRYQERNYDLADGGTLSLEIMTLADSRGAYSLLTLLAGPAPEQGAPGDFHVAEKDGLTLAAGNCWIRVRTTDSGDLARRVAVSVANRVGRTAPKPPNLVNHLPEVGADPASVRYFLGPKALAVFGTPVAGVPLPLPAGVEAAQASCTAGTERGTGTVLGFPSIQLAEDFFNSDSGPLQKISGRASLYTRQTGPLVGILDGNFSPQVADKTLGSLRFEYSIKWIFDKTSSQGRTIWGVPVRILGTVVRSLMFTAMLCLLSVVAGIMIAGARVYFRQRWGHPDDNGFIRLKIDEN